MGSKKYQNKTCAYCGVEGASTTADHVFAREFFLGGKRDNIPKVPSCNSCNNKKSVLEHYLATLLPFGGSHENSSENLSQMVPKRLNKNKRLHRDLHANQRSGWYKIDSGIIVRSMTLPLEFEKLKELMNLIVRGLAYKHMDVHLDKDDNVCVLALTDAGEQFFDNRLFNLKVKNRIKKFLSHGAVTYEAFKPLKTQK